MAARLLPAATSPSDYAVPLSMLSVSTSVSTSGVGEYVYDRQLLLDIRNKDFCYKKHWLSVVSELGLLRRGGPWKSAAPLGEPPVRRQRKRCERTREGACAEERMLG
ncbi:hypothetical protein AAFF_G00384530 [Aldrovandia affinis]|uniref:Uncharacterized protein n=1 Tax=Aldrovandia affinis TaxID=143900 RepID=A0AAD7R4I1_9TELE|nr:hypothetical protein AAFF_G00384530 [Aldrovandia affinis]